jgi:uncharacterized protein (DUF362 family)/Pyruvate/2-oxoacid:ferredoxin oxidoreductase delta subunit
MDRFVRPGDRVLIKPNLLSPAAPERAITTHPTVVEAVIRLVQRAGGEAVIADSAPASVPFTPAGLAHLYQATGMAEVAARTGARLNFDTGVADLAAPPGCTVRRFEVMRVVREVQCVISLPKLKTHSLTVLTGATKNCFGLIPGVRKMTFHLTRGRLEDFADVLLDLETAVAPVLVLMDAIVGMDGEGPSAGSPFPIGLVLGSTSGVELDAVAARVVGIPPLEVPTLRRGMERGLWSGRVEGIELLGHTLEEVMVSGFRRPAGGPPLVDRLVPFGLGPRLRRVLLRHTSRQPVVDSQRCTGCGSCQAVCPAHAIEEVGGHARINSPTCIRCYCCHEACPEAAISLVSPLVLRLLLRLRH